MLSLAEHQRGLLALLKGRAPAGADDPYLARVAGSKELEFLREVSLWWCAFGIRRSCPWTARLLERLGLFESCVAAFYMEEDVSPYIDRAGRQFLARFLGHPDSLLAALAQFELVSLRLGRGEAGAFAVDWDRNPDKALGALRTGDPIPPAELGRTYRLHMARDTMWCECIETE